MTNNNNQPVVKNVQNVVDMLVGDVTTDGEIDFELIVELIELAFNDVRVEGFDNEIFELSNIVYVKLFGQCVIWDRSTLAGERHDAQMS